METITALLALCEGNPPLNGGFLSQKSRNAKLWFFSLLQALTYCWMNSRIDGDLQFMCCHCNNAIYSWSGPMITDWLRCLILRSFEDSEPQGMDLDLSKYSKNWQELWHHSCWGNAPVRVQIHWICNWPGTWHSQTSADTLLTTKSNFIPSVFKWFAMHFHWSWNQWLSARLQ